MPKKKYTPVERARKGGIVRAARLSARRRSQIARLAVAARWANYRAQQLRPFAKPAA